MIIIWGIILFIISAIGFVGQLLSAVWPETAVRLGLIESEGDVDPAFYADVRGEALWDTVILWILPAAAVLLIFKNPIWPYFGLVGGGMYLYFAGRGIFVRRVLLSRKIAIGHPANVRSAFIFLAIWGMAAIITMRLAIAALPLP